jgi:Leucine-rich repeat (LRR) protein
MFRVTILLIFVIANLSVFGQAGQKPVFKSKADSIQFAKIRELRHPEADLNTKRLFYDSLSKVELPLLQKVVWQFVYSSRKTFTTYADLKSGIVHPDSVKQLSISNLRAPQVPVEVLKCKNLEELELVNTQIDELQNELNSLSHLNSIYLYNNVPSKRLMLGKNTHVNYLRIAGHHPEKLPKSYKSFSSLDSLNLNRSMATRLPNLKHNPELTLVNAVSNNITLKRYKGSKTLERLDLRQNKITNVPNSIGRKYPQLKALSFNSNPVKKVKPGLGKLKHLEFISFYGNMLSEIPAPVYKLTKLQVIDLFDNRIEAVSTEIKNLRDLKILYLANNRLYRLPDEIGELKNLEEVYIYNNRMDTLPASMDKLDKLRVLWVNDNFFHTIPATTWRAGKIDYLDASQNFIKRIPDEIAEAPLQTLILSGALMNKEKENAPLFERLRKQGTRIIYYTAQSDEPAENDEF